MSRRNGRSSTKNISASTSPTTGTAACRTATGCRGAFGYFPSYALGNAYGAQMLHNMEQDVDVEDSIAKGELAPMTAWLHEKVHQYGGLYVPADVVRNACGTFDPHYYTDYLTRKFSELYGL